MHSKIISATLIFCGAIILPIEAAASVARADSAIARPGSIEGVISNDSTKAPIVGAIVNLKPRFGKTGPDSLSDTTTYTTVSGPGGAYKFDSVAVGNFNVTVSDSGFITATVFIKTSAAKATLDIPLKVEPPPTSNVVGTIKDSATGLPISRALVILKANPRRLAPIVDSMHTDANGDFKFLLIQACPVGAPYTLVVTKHGYQDFVDTSVSVADFSTDTANVMLSAVTNGIIEKKPVASGWSLMSFEGETVLSIQGTEGLQGRLEIYRPDGRLLDDVKVMKQDRIILLPWRANARKPLQARFVSESEDAGETPKAQ